MSFTLHAFNRDGWTELIDQDTGLISSVVLPALCVRCDGEQLVLEHINLRRDTKTQRCEACGALWESPID